MKHGSLYGADHFVKFLLPLGLLLARNPVRAEAPATQPAKTTCADCHEQQGREFAASAHAGAGLECRKCHGGAGRYSVPPAAMTRLRTAAQEHLGHPDAPRQFNHGPDFTGKPARRDIPERCGECHSDVAAMNPYGLPTDQLAQYRLSGHGKALYEGKNEKVAVCTDCHGVHEIRKPKDTASRVYPANIPATCGHCHGDPQVMAGSNRSTRVVDEYRQSVHGQALLEHGDTGMPTCATCHGSHSAVPPGFRDVGHVCGRCHQQEERSFLESLHAKFEGFPRCVVCHTARVDLRDHRIYRIAASPASMEKSYAAVTATRPAASMDEEQLRQAYVAHREPHLDHVGAFCYRCHNEKREVGHRQFFGQLDREAVQRGDRIGELIMGAELGYAATAERVNRLHRGVLLLKDESLMLEELRTMTVGLAPLQHTLNLDKITEAANAQATLARQIQASLDGKERGLHWRYWTLIPMWGFVAVFVGALWTKYKRLKAQMVVPLSEAR